ncbi:Serine/threonine-protein kinase Nek9 [Mortierella hygrophila]|uniref:Serine/threonine-protein kinase Nek9 n=1 Tax=Mortierella hygrophila TaxID=979708 RepID=A0A9P6JXF3_9FUNG|nr:Serine/threonine-protein kinase Nek9 [Mortierella hygrophila]
MAAGVAHLHRNKLLHGDIKPVNILITEQNVVKLADLGEVRYMNKPLDRAVGSESHRAPEVTMEGKYGLPADIYSFGRTLEDMMINTRMEKNEAFLSFAARFMEFEPDRRPTADGILSEEFSALCVEELLEEEEEMKEENEKKEESENEKKEESEKGEKEKEAGKEESEKKEEKEVEEESEKKEEKEVEEEREKEEEKEEEEQSEKKEEKEVEK